LRQANSNQIRDGTTLRHKQAYEARPETVGTLCLFNAAAVISDDDLNAAFRLLAKPDLDGSRFPAIRMFDGIGEQLGYDQGEYDRFVRGHHYGRALKLYVFVPLSPPGFDQTIANLLEINVEAHDSDFVGLPKMPVDCGHGENAPLSLFEPRLYNRI